MATDFSSLDKLIEFGLGIGIATQMMNTMNTVIARTAIPGVGINPGVANRSLNVGNPICNVKSNTEYYVVYDEQVAGPLSESEMEKLVRDNKVGKKTLCWHPGLSSWKFAEEIPAVYKLLLLND